MPIDPSMLLAAQDAPLLASAVWLIPALPVAAFVVLVAFGRRLGDPVAGWVAAAGMAGSFVASVLTWFGLRQMPGEARHHEFELFTWMGAGAFQVELGFLVDPLSVTMSLFVTFVATVIFVYSIGYMKGDPDFSKFFVYLSFFAFSMLILVTGSNLLVTFLGWEGVGAASWFLISFWFQDDANASAGKKAFITNRVGDWGFLVAMFFTFLAFGTLNYSEIFASTSPVAATTISAIVMFLFLGAVGKSAQLPLSIWLPDAMAGPTPVSALMHAATMVTAGVYLMVRVNPLIDAADPWVSTTIAAVGGITALAAATVAIAQRDIKKVLAYSTVSQLGYMVMAVGSGAYVASIFHMITHAFFKALLFLGAGAVIHGMNHEQDMTWYGKLWKFFPTTGATFIVAWLAIAGVPPFSGFWSKGEILVHAWNQSPLLWFVGAVTALLTAYYMTREVILTFFGERRWTELDPRAADAGAAADEGGTDEASEATSEPAASEAASSESEVEVDPGPLPTGPGAPHHVVHGAPVQPTEAPPVMTVPLVILAVGAAVLGVLNLPFGDRFQILGNWLEPSVHVGETTWHASAALEWGLEAVAVILAAVGIAAGYFVYQRITDRSEQLRYEPPILLHAWYYDLGITAFMGGPVRRAAHWLAFTFEWYVIDGAVEGTARLLSAGARTTRRLQTGYVRNYALGLTIGAALLAIYVLYWASY